MALFKVKTKEKKKYGSIDMETLKAGKMGRSVLDLTADIVNAYGPRLAGSKACKAAAFRIKEELEVPCDTVSVDSFQMNPGAFYGWLKISAILYPILIILLWFGLPLVALLLISALLAVSILEFICYRRVLDPLFPRRTGYNVKGVIEPTQAVRQTFIVSGHHDSAPLFRYNALKKEPYLRQVRIPLLGYGAIVIIALITLFVRISASTVISAAGKFSLLLTLVSIIPLAAIPWVSRLFVFVRKQGSPGAGDNLVSSCIAVAAAQHFSAAKLKHTRLIFASFDAEEAGLRGSREFFQKHEFSDEVWHFNIDCPYYADELAFLSSDINGTVKLSQTMATNCVAVAEQMGYQAHSQPIAFFAGGTDAAHAARAGHHATTLIGIPWDDETKPAVYHTAGDTVETIKPAAVEAALSLVIKYAEMLDGGAFSTESIQPEDNGNLNISFKRITKR